MRGVVFENVNEVAVRDLPRPLPGSREALVAPRFVGLCGTDLELLEGTMPYLADGTASFPLRPGHEVTGVVVEAPPGAPAPGTPVVLDPIVGCGDCAACEAGRGAHCPAHRVLGVRHGLAGGAAELVAIPVANLTPLPAGLSLRDAVLAEPGVPVLNCLLAADPQPGMRALVVGAGTLGGLGAQMLRNMGLEVGMAIIDPSRREFVESLGFAAVERVPPRSYDVAVEVAGSPAAVRTAMAAVRPGGRVALAGVQPGPVDGFDANAIVLEGISVRGADVVDRFATVVENLASGAVSAEPLIEAVHDLEDAPLAYERLADSSRRRPKLILRIPPGGGFADSY